MTTSMYHSTSSEKSNGLFVSQVANVQVNNDGTANLQFLDAAILPIISVKDNPDHAAEVALLTRNVKIEGDEGEDRKGGYMQVLHTEYVAQIVQGVEFVNMGRLGEVDRFVSATI